MSSPFFSTKNRDLQSLSHQAATESWLISMHRSAKASSPGLRIPVVEISEKGYTVGSKNCTNFPPAIWSSGEEGTTPHAFQNVSFPPVEEALVPRLASFLESLSEKKAVPYTSGTHTTWVACCP